MAAGDFTGSTTQRINVAMGEMFQEAGYLTRNFNTPHGTLQALLANQTVRTIERLEGTPGGKTTCVGVKAWHIQAPGTYTVTSPTDCTIPEGDELETEGANYDSGILGEGAASVIAERCDNDITFARESAMAIKKAMDTALNVANEAAIDLLASDAMANIGTLQTGWVVNGTRVDVPAADFVWSKLGFFKANADQNHIYDQLVISGMNFYADWYNSQYTRLNDNERSIFAAFSNFNFHVDTLKMDSHLSRNSTFFVDRNVFAFWNTTYTGSLEPVKLGNASGGGERFAFIMPHPTLRYMRNGQMVPVLFEIEFEKICTGRNALKQLTFKYKYYAKLVGGLTTSIDGPNSETGIIEFSAT